MLHPVAVDLGAESGRVVRGAWDGARLTAEEVHRFPNVPVRTPQALHWDALRLFGDVTAGLRLAGRAVGRVSSIGVDAWGVDFALLDRDGALLGNPVHYRDRRTVGIEPKLFARVLPDEIYDTTGIQFIGINTLYQLMAMVEARSPQLEAARTFLMMPDLLHYWLCGTAASEYTNASTTQLLDARTRQWATALAERCGIPAGILPPLVAPGTALGPLLPEIAVETGLGAVPVIAPTTHDTAAAVAALPFATPRPAYVSCGTWALVGAEVPEPIITPATRAANLTNEGGIGGILLLRNVTGLWLVQECQRGWAASGSAHTYADLVALAATAAPFGPLIDPDAPDFLAPRSMVEAITRFCIATGQAVLGGAGATVRCVLESLALAWRATLAEIAVATGQPFDALHIVGGGARNALLCQLAADATGLLVVAGPTEATATGNLLVQLIAAGEIGSLAQARAVVRGSEPITRYDPHPSPAWDDAYARFLALRNRQV